MAHFTKDSFVGFLMHLSLWFIVLGCCVWVLLLIRGSVDIPNAPAKGEVKTLEVWDIQRTASSRASDIYTCYISTEDGGKEAINFLVKRATVYDTLGIGEQAYIEVTGSGAFSLSDIKMYVSSDYFESEEATHGE